MDDTIFETPRFCDFVGLNTNGIIDDSKYFKEYFNKIKFAFIDKLNKTVYFMKQGDFVIPVNKANNETFPEEFIEYFTTEKKYKKFFEAHDGIIVIRSFPGFHNTPDTLGKICNTEIIKDYIDADKKMIITGRDERLRSHILEIFKELELELPNYGLVLYQSGSQSIMDFKTAMILKTIEINGWEEVHFYEDRADWLYNAEKAVNEKYPNVKFVPHLITNIKEKMKLN